MLIGGGGVVLAGTALLKPHNNGAPHNTYFLGLTQALKQAGLAQPTLIIDKHAFDYNIQQVQQSTVAKKLPVRLVVKSLPSSALLDYLSTRLQTQRFMVFNLPMLNTVLNQYPQGDFLLGKPIAALAVQEWLKIEANRAVLPNIQWLIDSLERFNEYTQLAAQFKVTLRVNFEIDVGLHRGGFTQMEGLANVVKAAKANAQLRVTGLMGYEAHIGKMPSLLNMQQRAWDTMHAKYQQALTVLEKEGYDPAQLTLNAGGSPTYTLHTQRPTLANELSIGSAFVQPIDFDLATLSQHQAACFIATPVLKALDHALIPAVEWADGIRHWWDANNQQGYFIHGGNWLAKPVSPLGLSLSALYGRSSNQELWLGAASQQLKANDYVFFRPQQSEAVFLQFGDIALFDKEKGQIVDKWPVFSMSA